MGELRDVSKDIKLVDEGNDLQVASNGSEKFNECLAVRDKKIGQVVQIAEYIFQEYMKFDDNFEQISGKVQAMQIENTELKENEGQLKSLAQKQMKELMALEGELEKWQRAEQWSQETIQQLRTQCTDLDKLVQAHMQEKSKKEKLNAEGDGKPDEAATADLADITEKNRQLQDANDGLQ